MPTPIVFARAHGVLVAAMFCGCCVEPQVAHSSRAAVPVKSACTATSRPAASVGFDVRAGRRHSEAQTMFITNLGSETRTVSVQQVSRLEGPCSADWARETPLDYIDSATGAPPEKLTVRTNDRIELKIGPQRVAATWECTKLGLALWMKVDDDVVCSDVGAWIATPE